MPCPPHPFVHARAKLALSLAAALLLASLVAAETPKLNIRTKNGLPLEEQGKQQLERLAKQYDLSKYTITRDILIERGAVNHSRPVLTLNMHFLDDDDLFLSAYVHEQAHWLITDRHPHEAPVLFQDLQQAFPNLDYHVPEGDGELRSSYFHIAVCMLEWQAMEELVGPKRAFREMEWKQQDHYKAIYALVLANRDQVEEILKRHNIKW
jgi:hypothetical protein